jgi:4-aminobutyrate aminotransferase-like enzyme
MAGGCLNDKEWMINLDQDIHQVPFPNAFKYEWADESRADYSDEKCFGKFLQNLHALSIKPDEIAGIMTETFQGGWVQLMPKGFVQQLRKFCTENDILLIFDEVQAGFGRTGKLFGFMHADIIPDIICCGKGISSGMPLSCVVGRSDIMNLYGPNQMTSTHTGNPISSSAALASINYIVDHNLAENAHELGEVCRKKLGELKRKYSKVIGFVSGCGLVWSVIFTKPGTKDIDADLAHDIVERSVQKGLLFFAPVGAGATIKICPPLVIDEEALLEGLSVLDAAISEALPL